MLRFIGRVRSGKGKHSELVIPGAANLNGAPPAWPAKFQPGSLNVGILKDGYPEGLTDPDEGGRGVTLLDIGSLEPTVILPWDRIGNNGLRPKAGKPRRGTGQFWPALLYVMSTGKSADCWVFRRVDSTIKLQLEIVSALHLKSHLSLIDGMDDGCIRGSLREERKGLSPVASAKRPE
jgi:hypothetical protein